jgi:hypothetical protein
MRHFSYCILLLLLSTGSCNYIQPPAEQTEIPLQPPESNLGKDGTELLEQVLKGYYNLKTSLVKDNAADADKSAAEIIEIAGRLKQNIANDSTVNKTVVYPVDSVITGCSRLIKDKGCERKRIYFRQVSDAMYSLIKQSSLKNIIVYRQYCPMAFNDLGAYWLSSSSKIRNPYFGQKMSDCGEVTEMIK